MFFYDYGLNERCEEVLSHTLGQRRQHRREKRKVCCGLLSDIISKHQYDRASGIVRTIIGKRGNRNRPFCFLCDRLAFELFRRYRLRLVAVCRVKEKYMGSASIKTGISAAPLVSNSMEYLAATLDRSLAQSFGSIEFTCADGKKPQTYDMIMRVSRALCKGPDFVCLSIGLLPSGRAFFTGFDFMPDTRCCDWKSAAVDWLLGSLWPCQVGEYQ